MAIKKKEVNKDLLCLGGDYGYVKGRPRGENT